MSRPVSVLALCDDLFFSAKIEATSTSLGVPVRCTKDPEDLLTRLDRGEATLVLVDLGLRAADAVAAIRALKARAPLPRVVAFGSHVDGETLAAARAAGADRVLARSAFSAKLADLLREPAESPDPPA